MKWRKIHETGNETSWQHSRVINYDPETEALSKMQE
jgi:hypothetical protein